MYEQTKPRQSIRKDGFLCMMRATVLLSLVPRLLTPPKKESSLSLSLICMQMGVRDSIAVIRVIASCFRYEMRSSLHEHCSVYVHVSEGYHEVHASV